MNSIARPTHTCPVCGYPHLAQAPRSASGGGSYEICPSCGYQFGVDDDDRQITPADHRARWVEKGMAWFSRGIPAPKNWRPQDHLDALLRPRR